jgi:hypothetical protein
MEHPHPDKLHVLKAMRRHILGAKKSFGTARSLVHYHELLETYLTAKRQHLAGRNQPDIAPPLALPH